MKLDHDEFKFALQTYKTLTLTKSVLVAGALLHTKGKCGGGGAAVTGAKSAFGGAVFTFGDKGGQTFAAPTTGNMRCGRDRGQWRANARGGGDGEWRGREGS